MDEYASLTLKTPSLIDDSQMQQVNLSVHDSLEIDDQNIKTKRQWGNCKPFLFKDDQEPVIVIGPHWPLFVVAFLVFAVISVVMIIFSINSNLSISTILFTSFICLSQLSSYLLVALRNPGVANLETVKMKKEKINEKRKYGEIWYCNACNLAQLPQTVHCTDCKVCILEMDHHCPWTGKCIGKGNLKEFYSFLICTLLFMIVNIIVSMSQAVNQKQ